MRRSERWALRIGCLLTAATGIAYGYVRYFLRANGEFGPEPHPWQSPLQHAHVLVAPLLVFALGFAVRGHASGMLAHRVRRGRRTGLSLMGLGAPMVLSGYAVQLVTDSGTRVAIAWVHGVSSLLFVVIYVLHWLKPWRQSVIAQATHVPSLP